MDALRRVGVGKPVASLSAAVLKVQAGHAFELEDLAGRCGRYFLSVRMARFTRRRWAVGFIDERKELLASSLGSRRLTPSICSEPLSEEPASSLVLKGIREIHPWSAW